MTLSGKNLLRKSSGEHVASSSDQEKKSCYKKMTPPSIPKIICVSAPSAYKTFITQLFGPCEYEQVAPKLAGIEMQCRALQVQGALGFGAIVTTAKYGSFLIISLPRGQRNNAQFASRLVSTMAKAAFWWGDSPEAPAANRVCKFEQCEIDRIVKDTKHMTKCHVPLLGLAGGACGEQVGIDPAGCGEKYVELARQLCSAAGNERADARELRSKLPMLANLEDDDDLVEAMAEDGRLVPVLQNYFGLAGDLAKQIEEGCLHEAEVVDTDERCGECLARVCTGSKMNPCGCGASVCGGSRLRFRCSKCSVVLCSRCRGEAECRRLNREAEAEIVARMRAGRPAPAPRDEILAIVDNLPDEELFEPASPALMRLLKKVGEDRRAAQRRQEMDRELDRELEEERAKLNGVLYFSSFQHPFEFDGVEAAEMKRDQTDQVRALLRHTMEERRMQLRQPSREEVLAQFPAFVQLCMELFGSSYSGPQARDNLLNKCARPMFESFVKEFDESFRMPEIEKAALQSKVREQLDRILHNDPSITRCRACGHKFQSERDGPLCCSKKCEKKHREEQRGRVCHVCCEACVGVDEFYNEDEDVWHPASLLDMSEQELDGQALKPQHLGFVLETRNNRNPMMFCSDRCQQVWSAQPVCATCGEPWDGSTRSETTSANVADIVKNAREGVWNPPQELYAPACRKCVAKGCRGEAAAERPCRVSIRPRRAIC